MDIDNIPITELIPQRSPFIMVDRVVCCDEVDAKTEFLIRRDNILLDEEMFLSEAGIIENMAQSCAARMGYVDLLHGEPIKIGYIGEVQNASILKLPRSGETLFTQIHVVEEIFNCLIAEVVACTKDKTIATARIKVAKTNIIANPRQ